MKPLPKLTDQQRALLTLLDAAGIEGISLDGLILNIRSAGFEDLTRDDVLGKGGLQTLGIHGLAKFAGGRCGWTITRKGKEALAA